NSQQAAIQATGTQLRGEQRVAFDRYGVLTLTDELYAYAVQNNALNQDSNAPSKSTVGQAYLEARKQLTPLSPLLSPDYTRFDSKGFRTETDFGKYEADTYIVSARLADEHRSNFAQISSGWNAKSDSYVAILAILAISLFLFALAGTLGGIVRWLFIVVGLGIGTVALIWMGLTIIIPIHGIPEEALQKVAEGTGYAAQATEYYFVGQGIAGMPLPYDVNRVTEPTDIYKTNADQYATHTNEYWQKAIDAYSQAIQLDPTYANAYNLRGIARRMITPEQAQGAVADLKAAIENGGAQYGTYWNLGLAQYDVGDFSGAIESSRNALKLNDRICGPDFTIGLATLAQGKLDEASQVYEQALSRCDSIYHDALNQKQRPPESLWSSMEGASDDLDNMICVLSKQNCYANRNLPNLSDVANPGAVVTRAQLLRKRVKEAHTALEYMGTTQVTPTGARFAPLTFGYYMVNPNDPKEFLNYAEKKVFPYNEFSIAIDSFSSYSGMKKDYLVIWKVRRNGVEDPGLRYADKWNLEQEGPVVRPINSWYLLLPGQYELEIYVNGELVQSGSFEISP
ncbi:MAG TPA: tetratricopeptide repeat protein, partial [Anaerolineae bacterium]|nr:tetratricopeptide repeat protein [Anaerolineae bacterium]